MQMFTLCGINQESAPFTSEIEAKGTICDAKAIAGIHARFSETKTNTESTILRLSNLKRKAKIFLTTANLKAQIFGHGQFSLLDHFLSSFCQTSQIPKLFYCLNR
jgi:hypothetical protein